MSIPLVRPNLVMIRLAAQADLAYDKCGWASYRALSRFFQLSTKGVKPMKNGNLTMLIAETGVGQSDLPGALESHVRDMYGDRQVVVLNCVEHGVPAGLDGRLVGHPQGYVGYRPAQGLLAMLELGRFLPGQGAVILDDEPVKLN